MEAKNKFIEKILPIFINAGFGVEKFDDTTFDDVDGTSFDDTLSEVNPIICSRAVLT